MTIQISDALAELRRQFAAQLSTRLDAIRAQFQRLDRAVWQQQELEVLHRLLHGLTGSAGTFGMHSVSEVALQMENRLAALLKTGATPTEAEWLAIAAELGRLDQLARIRLESGAPSLKPPPVPPRLDYSPLIHLVEDDPAQAVHLSQALRDEGYRVRVFATSAGFRAACGACIAKDAERPAAVVMDMIFSVGDAACADGLAELKSDLVRCPPVVFVSVRDDIETRLAAFRAGGCRYLTKPVDPDRLVSLLDVLTGRQPPQPYRVLLVDDDQLLLETHAVFLRSAGMEVHTLSQPLRILDVLNGFEPDVVLLDVHMPEASGPELAAVLRERDEHLQVPILFLSSESDMTQQLLALSLGGDDFLVKPVQPDHLVAAVTVRARRSRQNRVLSLRLQTALYEREREHLALDQHAIVSIADAAGNISYVNDKFCEFSGYSRGELMGQNHRILRSGEHPPAFYTDLWHTIADGKVWQGEICNRRKDGSLYWVESTITPFLDSDGIPYQYVSIRTDISHVKAVEIALRESESRMNQAEKITKLGSFEWNLVSGELTWSDEHYRLWGLAPGSAKPSFELFQQGINPDDLIKLKEALQRTQEQNEVLDFAYRMTLPDGRERVMNSRGECIYDAAGKAIKMVGSAQDVTERRRIEQEAQSSKERLRRGQLFANIGTWDWNIQTGELYWTERIAPLFGYPVGELETSYDNFLAAIHPDDSQAVIDAVNACVERDAPYEIEHRVVWPDGTVRWLLERGAVLRDADGKPLQMLGVVQDVDDRKCAELALAERERQLREAQSLARIGNWKADLVSGELVWSDEIYRIFGHEPGSFQPSVEAFNSAVHPDDRERVRESEEQARKSGRHDVVHRIVRPDGTVRHVHELAQAEYGTDGSLVGLAGTVQDITERVAADARLRESEAKLSGLFELSPLGIALTDMNGRYLEFNPAFQAICGYPAEELKNLDYWALTPRDYEEQEARQLESLRKTGRYGPYEKAYRQKNGQLIPIRLNGILVEGQAGQPQIWSIVEDISDSKQTEQALIAARDEADRANQAKSVFLSSMSHELRTPMNAILGFSQLMEYDAALPAEHQDNVQEILKAGHHLLDLINEVLDLSKVESGNIDLSLEPVEVEPIVEECLSLVGAIADAHHIRITHAGLAGAAVRADRMRLKQALLNLLSNAIKYNREGGSVKIEMQAESTDRLRIRVSDSGLGIPTAHLAELFKPFNRLGAENSEIEGTGIGLTITRRIVEMMGGTVGVESAFGEGSSFWIELPTESLPGAVHAHEHTAGGSAKWAQDDEATQHTVLYIEDNPANLKLVAHILGRHKHVTLLTAHTAELGIELARTRRPELILLDINMPGMNGYQVLEVFKAEPVLKDIPVVAITANAMPRDIKRGMEAGFVDYLTKPLDVARFHAVVDRVLSAGRENGQGGQM